MIRKNVYDLLSAANGSPTLLDTTSGLGGTVYGSKVVDNFHANTGKVFIELSGFHVPDTSTVNVTLYESFNKNIWFKNSDIVTVGTALCSSYPISNLGPYLRIGYSLYQSDIDNCRFRLQLDEETL